LDGLAQHGYIARQPHHIIYVDKLIAARRRKRGWKFQ